MEMMMTTRSVGPIDDSSSTSLIWKLYDNPHYTTTEREYNSHLHLRHRPLHSYTCLSKSSRSSYHARDLGSFARPMDRDVDLSDLDNALAEIKELRAELEFERRMRRKVEALNRALTRELEEERNRREAAEGTCRRMAEEIAGVREEAERAMKEVEDERRMLRMAEAMREERVQMKLSEAKFLMEEKIKEMMPVSSVESKSKDKDNENVNNSNADAVQRKEVENPHIKRGIKGMEFPRAVRARSPGVGSSPGSREGRGATGHLGSNLECQRAQLRVLMRHKSPAGSGIVGAPENLVM